MDPALTQVLAQLGEGGRDADGVTVLTLGDRSIELSIHRSIWLAACGENGHERQG
jgi:hypothetical protein